MVNTQMAKVYRLYGPRDLRLDLEKIVTDQGGYLCKTLYSAISVGTELSAFLGEPPLREGPQYPRLQGYLNVALVLENLNSDDLSEEGESLLDKIIITYSSHRDYFVLNSSDFYQVIPKGEDIKKYVLTYIYHLSLSAILKASYSYNDLVFVYGSGLISLASIQLYKSLGLQTFCITSTKERIDLAISSGADHVYTNFNNEKLFQENLLILLLLQVILGKYGNLR